MSGKQRKAVKKWLVIFGVMVFLAVGLISTKEDSRSGANKSVVTDVSIAEETVEETEITTEENTEESTEESTADESGTDKSGTEESFDLSSIPEYSGNPYVAINDNVPYFTDAERKEAKTSYERYSDLDKLGRCGVCVASVGQDIMPTEERGSIGSVKPTGWKTVKYNGVVDGNYLYNRCHLIGYQLTGENANTKNLITGTRYLNIEGMLPFENMVADYVKETGNHVLYRVTPVFDGNNLVTSGVIIEAESIEDSGDGILFNVYAYNVQPGITIDYATGDSQLDGRTQSEKVTETVAEEEKTTDSKETMVWIPNSGTKYHSNSSCSDMVNPTQVTESEAISKGYEACKKCH